MLKIKRILCPIDFTEFSEKAFDYALSLAQHYRANLFLQHVVDMVTSGYPNNALLDSINKTYAALESRAEEQLRDIVRAGADSSVRSHFFVHVGLVADSILALAETQGIDLIVMGTHGRRGFDRFAMGSVTEKVLRKARCPVLAVRNPSHDFVSLGKDEEPVQLRKILLGTDFSDFAHHAADFAFSLATEYDAEITILHVLENIPSSRELQAATDEVKHRLEEFVPAGARNGCKTQIAVRLGKPYQEIIQLALETQADLVILGVRGRNALDLALFGSTTHRVLQLGPCPVLTVRV